jgi:hypothetical protein
MIDDLIEDIELIEEIPDSEVEWVEELMEVYIEGGEEFFLDDLVNDFSVFCRYMFFRKGFKAPTTLQQMIIDFIAEPSELDKLIQAPRGAGKSYIAQLKTMFDLNRNNDEVVLVRSASDKRSRNWTTFLLNTIKTTPILQHLSPRSNQRKSTELFDVNGAEVSDSPSVSSYSIKATVTGLRASKAVLDDIEVIGNSSSESAREGLVDQISECFNLLSETYDADGKEIVGEVLVLGTFQSSQSIYVDMIRSGLYKTLILPAEYPPLDEWYLEFVDPRIMEVSRNNPDKIGRAIDERINDRSLARKKLLGRTNYELHYMLNPNLTDELKYPLKLRDLIITDIDPIDNPIRITYSSEEKIKDLKHKGFNKDYYVRPAWMSEERSPFDFTILAVDPSGRGGDETGYVVYSLMGGKLYVRDFGGLEGGYDDISLDTLVGISQKYGINALIVESNFGDGAYTKMLETKLLESDYMCEVVEVRATKQKEARIIDTLEPLLNQHRIIVDRASIEKDLEVKSQYSLSYQLTHLTKEKGCLPHDDRIDVWELGASYLVEYMAKGDTHAIARHEEQKEKDLFDIIENGFFPNKNNRVKRSYKKW